MTSNCLSFETP